MGPNGLHREPLKGIDFVDSFNMNAHKMLMTNFDCSPVWFSDASLFTPGGELAADSSMLARVGTPAAAGSMADSVPDYRHWQIPFGRRFRALKLWFVLRSYGQNGIKASIREQVKIVK